MLLLPMPVIGAINGHTAGNGSILACCCDFRLMKADRGYFFFPEVDLNIPFLPSMQEVMKKTFPYYKLVEATLTGKLVFAIPRLSLAHHVIYKASTNVEGPGRSPSPFAQTFKKGSPFSGEKKNLSKTPHPRQGK